MIKPQYLSKILLTLLALCVVTAATMSAQTLTTLVDFNNSNAGQPESSLVQVPFTFPKKRFTRQDFVQYCGEIR